MPESTEQGNYWRQVEDLFHQAIALPGEARAEFLRERCGGDGGLEREVQELVDSYDAQDSLAVSSAPHPGQRYGSYEIVSKIGSGGMGDVYLARRWEDFDQRVALKLISGAHFSQPWLIERFRRERQILAKLDHPNIARLLNGGVTEAGVPYLVMEYVEGARIDEYCEREALSIGDRVRLFQTVCSAVESAHENLIIHRDLKPGNILVNKRGEPKLLDFGIAKVLAPDKASDSLRTTSLTGNLLLTPRYASPERLRGEPATVSSDIYCLGVILYQLLTGSWPYGLASDASTAAVVSATLEEDARAPSDAGPADRRKQLRRGLDRIVLKALEKQAADRYQSARELRDDLQRFLDRKPVMARKATVATRRYRWWALCAAAVALMALLAWWMFRR